MKTTPEMALRPCWACQCPAYAHGWIGCVQCQCKRSVYWGTKTMPDDKTYTDALQAVRLQGTEETLLATVARIVDLYQRRQFDISYPSEVYDELTNAYDAYQRVRCPDCIARMPTTQSPLSPCPEHQVDRL